MEFGSVADDVLSTKDPLRSPPLSSNSYASLSQSGFDMVGEGDGIIRSVWGNRVVLLSAFGLVGVGAVIGAGSVYFFYIRNKIQDLFQIQSTLSSQLQQLRKDLDNGTGHQANGSVVNFRRGGEELYQSGSPKANTSGSSPTLAAPGKKTSIPKRTVRFRDGYETTDEDEYVTASSDSDFELEPILKKKPSGSSDKVVDAEGEDDSWAIEFLQNIDSLLDGDSESQHEAYIRLQSYKDKLESSCEFWWRFAKATHMESVAAAQGGDNEMKKSLIFAGCSRAERALQLDDNSPNAHKWFAITTGSKGEYVSVNEKIKNGFIFKEHVDKAVGLNPSDPSLHYLLGRFCLEVSSLSWVERRVAATLFSEPPNATPQEALQHFQASERLGKPLKDNRLYMAKCYIVLKNLELGALWLKQTLEMPNISSSDKPIHDEATKLFAKYKQYLK